MVLTETPICDFGQAAKDFKLPDYNGKNWKLSDFIGENGTLIMFICNHCPYVKAIQIRLVSDAKTLETLGIKCVSIMSNDSTAYLEDSVDNMKRVAEAFAYPFPYLVDESQEIAKAYGAVCTPDFFGYNNKLELQYRGRLDSSGKVPANDETKRDLVDAMRLVAETGAGPRQQIASIGCSIKWKQP